MIFDPKTGEYLDPRDRWLCSTGIEIALIAAAVVSAAATVAASQAQAQAANQAANFSKFQAKQAEVQGILEGNEVIRSANKTQAANLARFGAAGIALGEGGVPEQVNEAVKRDAEHNLRISRFNTANTAQSFRMQASQQAMQARAMRLQGFARAGGQVASAGTTAFG